MITTLQTLWKRLLNQISSWQISSWQTHAIHAGTPTVQLGSRKSWAATHPVMERLQSGISWKVEISVPHENAVSVERFPTCLVITIPKPGARLDATDTLQLLRRTIPLTEITPNGEPHFELEGDCLTITCNVQNPVSCDFSAQPSVLSAQLK